MTTYAPGSGLGAYMGSGIETAGSYGTLAGSINKWTAFESFDMKVNQTWVDGSGIHGGYLGRFDNEKVLTKADAAGQAKANFYYNGLLRYIGSLMGGLTTAPVQNGSTTAYTTTFTGPASAWNQSLSVQAIIPDVAQTGHFFNTLGVKVTGATFEVADGGALTCQFDLDAQDYFEAASGTTPTAGQPAGQPYFAWHQSAIKIGAYGSEAKVDGCKKWNLQVKRAADVARFNMGNVTTNPNLVYAIKDEPVDNGFLDISGTLDTEYLNDTVYENYYQTNTPFSMITTFTSSVMAGTGFPYSVSFNAPRCRFVNAELPSIKGPGIVQPSMPFVVLNDGTHPQLTVSVTNTDTTL